MRIISGKFKGRRFYPPAGKWPTRPTTDFAREGIFNILSNRFDFADVHFLDLFGGTGSHSFEMISRGCTNVTYVDNHRGCIHFVRALVRELDVEHCISIHRADVFDFCKKVDMYYNYIFAGPPYALPEIRSIPDLIFAEDLLSPSGLFILEHNRKVEFTEHPRFEDERKYGQCRFSLFTNAGELA